MAGFGKKDEESKSKGSPDDKGPSNTPAEGPGDQGHGAGDPQAQITRSASTRGGRRSDEYEPYEVTGRRAEGLFQSEEAKAALADPSKAEEYERDGIPVAKVSSDFVEATVPAVDMSKLEKLVKVKPRQSVARFRVGLEWYSVKEGEVTLVPRHVAQHMEEKGIL